MEVERALPRAVAAAATAVLVTTALAAAALAQESPASAIYGYDDFYGVPHLGHESVSGSGCGGDGSIGDTIPDGLWRGYVRSFDGPTLFDSTSFQFDLVCVYGDDVDHDLVAEWRRRHPGEAEPWTGDGFMVNNNPRTRTMLTAGERFWGHGTELTSDGACPLRQHAVPFDQSRDVWIGVAGGRVQWAVSSCGGPGSVPPPPTTVPPTAPPSAGWFPYPEFWAVPQLGDEPVHGSGCGGDGSIGDTIPDGLWYGQIEGLDGASMQFDLMCMYLGEVGRRLGEEFLADNPHYGSPPYWPGVGFLVNNSERTRTVPLAPGFRVAEAQGSGLAQCIAPPAGSGAVPLDPDAWQYSRSWIALQGGLARWALIECPHD